jgi:hypothetical protein
LKTADGKIVYPTLQFVDGIQVIPGLSKVIRCLRASGVDDWTLAGWLVSPLRALGRQSAIEWLRFGNDQGLLWILVRDTARRFAQ